MHIGDRLKQAREAAGLSLRDVGARFGITGQAVGYWESMADHPEERLVPLAELYGVPAHELRYGQLPATAHYYAGAFRAMRRATQATAEALAGVMQEFEREALGSDPVAAQDRVAVAATKLRVAEPKPTAKAPPSQKRRQKAAGE